MEVLLGPAEPAAPTEPRLTKKRMEKLENSASKAVEAAVEGKD